MNRLSSEKSPYLLQHAENPVDWYPWGDDAFAAARREDKLVFLSVGYTTCHWCHVMAHESFEDAARRRRPQRALHLHQGGPRGAARRRPRLHGVRAGDDGRRRVADERVADAGPEAVLRRHVLPADRALGQARVRATCCSRWRGCGARSAARVERAAEGVDRTAGRDGRGRAGGRGARRRARSTARRGSSCRSYDSRNGGFGGAPKFPRPSELLFLLRGAPADRRRGSARRRRAHAARRWRPAGMRDHVGGGFHRYSVDARVAGAALREDALRPGAAGARVSRGRAGDGRSRSSSTWPRTRCATCSAT